MDPTSPSTLGKSEATGSHAAMASPNGIHQVRTIAGRGQAREDSRKLARDRK
jgi:hypothetical protein